MIIIRYLVRETLKSQLAILFILLLIFFCQKLVRILGAAVDGDIPANLVLSLLGLGVPEMAQLILPLSLFLGLLMTLGKLYTESEITVMHACGLSKAVLVKAAMVLALFTSIVAAVNVMWAGPWSSRHQDEVLAEAKANPGMAALAQGQFQQATNGSSVLFIESVDGSSFKDVFLAQIRPKGNARPSVVVADSGHLTQLRDGSQVVVLNKGTRFEGPRCCAISALPISRTTRRLSAIRPWRWIPMIPTRWICAHCGIPTTLGPVRSCTGVSHWYSPYL